MGTIVEIFWRELKGSPLINEEGIAYSMRCHPEGLISSRGHDPLELNRIEQWTRMIGIQSLDLTTVHLLWCLDHQSKSNLWIQYLRSVQVQGRWKNGIAVYISISYMPSLSSKERERKKRQLFSRWVDRSLCFPRSEYFSIVPHSKCQKKSFPAYCISSMSQVRRK